MKKELFFSIVVPAHNEEKYIEATLRHLQNLDYPKDSFEVIVVENGSNDETYAKAKAFASDHFKIFSVKESGVSHARNVGISKVSPNADWVFFLDADTFPEPPFLKSLVKYLKENEDRTCVVGTAEIQPFPKSPGMNFIYGGTNFFFRLRSTPYGGALFVRRDLVTKAAFDEDLQMGEDESFAKDLSKSGKFFFFNTKLVHTSTRRYQNGGWKKIPAWIGLWLFAMIQPPHANDPASFHRRLKYKAVR